MEINVLRVNMYYHVTNGLLIEIKFSKYVIIDIFNYLFSLIV